MKSVTLACKIYKKLVSKIVEISYKLYININL